MAALLLFPGCSFLSKTRLFPKEAAPPSFRLFLPFRFSALTLDTDWAFGLSIKMRLRDQPRRAFSATADNPSAIYYNPAGIRTRWDSLPFGRLCDQPRVFRRSHCPAPRMWTRISNIKRRLSFIDPQVAHGADCRGPWCICAVWFRARISDDVVFEHWQRDTSIRFNQPGVCPGDYEDAFRGGWRIC